MSKESTIFSYHHTALERNTTGVQEVDGSTIYRVASVTKVFTVLAILLTDGMCLDDPIGKYVEELRGQEWEDMTLRTSCSQISGLPRNGDAFDLAPYHAELEPLGLPPLSQSDFPTCDFPGKPDCSRQEFFQTMFGDGLVWPIGDKASYSNFAYVVLGFALENATGLPYEQVIQETILDPLGMTNTAFTPPAPWRAAIGPGLQTFDFNFGHLGPTGGMYSTVKDLGLFLRSILNSTLLSPGRTREWLKPVVFTSSLVKAVGAPWEIMRFTDLTPQPRPVDHYTKSGGLPGYAAYIIVVPEYDLGVAIAAAGPGAATASNALIEILQRQLVPALDSLARYQAQQIYAGHYESKDGNRTASLTLALDSGPGLKVSQWTNLGKDMLLAGALLLGETAGANETVGIDVRIYPTGIGNKWRVMFDLPEGHPLASSPVTSCFTWALIDNFHYGGLSLDEFEFVMAGNGVQGVKIPALRATLSKV